MTKSRLRHKSGFHAARAVLLATVFGLSASPDVEAADCFDGLRVGLFTERAYAELDGAWRDRTNDPKVDHAARTALRGLRADVSLVEADALENALAQARGEDLPVLAYLDVEANSSEIPMQYGTTKMVTIESAFRLQFLNSQNGSVLGESSDFDKTTGLDIEQALPDLLQVSSIATMAEEAGRAACKRGLSGDVVVAEKPTGQETSTQPATPAHDAALVSQIQYALNDLGYGVGTPDGIVGSQTEQAIKQAQIAMRLTPDGQADESLLAKLEGHRRQTVIETQQLLNALGRIKGQPSGVLNDETSQAIETVELEQGLPFDGKPDADVISVLKAELRGTETRGEVTTDDGAADATLRFRIEQLLVDLGYMHTQPTGEDTLDSQEAIRRAEMKFGLPADGQPDMSLYRKLEGAKRGS